MIFNNANHIDDKGDYMKIIQPMTSIMKNLMLRSVKNYYRPSRYNIIVDYDGATLLYNILTRELAEIDSFEKEVLEKKLITVSEYQLPEKTRIIELLQKHLIVEIQEDETQTYFEVYNIIKSMTPPKAGIGCYKIFTTTVCNARCFYCFEGNITKLNMNTDCADSVARYILETKKEGKLILSWFGGEPLCNTKAIDLITKRLHQENVEFVSEFTTNGYLFNRNNVNKAVNDWNTKKVQITLDGMDDEHNRRKAFTVSSSNPFREIIGNIHLLLDANIHVSIRINIDQNNVDDAKLLVDFLDKEFPKKKHLSVYPSILFEECAAWKDKRKDEAVKQLEEACSEIRKDIDNREFIGTGRLLSTQKRLSRNMRLEFCMSNNSSCSVIGADGKLYTCQSLTDSEEYSYGDIWNGITNPTLREAWLTNDEPQEKCRECKWLPECTAFSMCPVTANDCAATRSDIMRSRIIATYRHSKTPQEPVR